MNSNSFTWLSDRSSASPCMARAACDHNVGDTQPLYQQPSRHAGHAASAPDASTQPACAAGGSSARGAEAGFTWISEVIDSISDDRELHQARGHAPVPFKAATASLQPHRGAVMHRQPNKQHATAQLNTSPAPPQPCSPAQLHTSHLAAASTSNRTQHPVNGNAKKPWHARRRTNKPDMYPMQQTHHRHATYASPIHTPLDASHNLIHIQQSGAHSLRAHPTATTRAGCLQLPNRQHDLAHSCATPLPPVDVSAGRVARASAAAATATAAATTAASLASNVLTCMGAAASSVLDRLLGVDPTLEVATAAAAGQAAAGVEVPCVRCLDQVVAPQQQQQPQLLGSRLLASNMQTATQQQQLLGSRLLAGSMQTAAQQQQPTPLQQASQQGLQAVPLQQQQSRQQFTGALGARMAATLAMFPFIRAAATAVEAAYTESIRPGAELIWHVLHAVLLYLVLPVLQVMLAALQMAMRTGSGLLQVAVWVSRRFTLKNTNT